MSHSAPYSFASTCCSVVPPFFSSSQLPSRQAFIPAASASPAAFDLVMAVDANSSPLPGWRLVRHIDLHIEQDEDGWYVVSTPRLLVHGYASSLPEAVLDYWESLVEYFEDVEASANAGDSQDSELLGYLSGFLARCE